jgi:opacity protein-like surface antigen
MTPKSLILAGFLALPLSARAMPARIQVFEAAVRSAPQPTASVVHVLVEGTDVSVSEERFGAYRKVRLPGGKTGFVDERALSLAGAASVAPQAGAEPTAPGGAAQIATVAFEPSVSVASAPPRACEATATTVAATVLRSGPDAGAPIVFQVEPGVRLCAVAQPARGFRRVKLPTGESGFAPEGALRVVAVAAVDAYADVPPVVTPARWAAPVQPAPAVRALSPAPSAQGIAAPAPPSNVPADFYAVVKVGGYAPQHEDLSNFGAGFDGEVAIGHRFTSNLALEAAAGWFRSTTNVGDGALSIIPLTATGKVILPVEQLELYGLAGAGVYFASYSASSDYGSVSSSGTAFGFHLGGGAALRVTPAVSLGAELRYLFANPRFSGDAGTGKAHLNGLRFAATLEYRF